VTRPHKPKQRRNGAIYICMCFVTAGPFSSPSHPLLSSWDFSLIRPTTELRSFQKFKSCAPLRLAIMPSGEVNVRPLSRLAILHYSMLAFLIGRRQSPKGGHQDSRLSTTGRILRVTAEPLPYELVTIFAAFLELEERLSDHP
jgi:hypothetical protein